MLRRDMVDVFFYISLDFYIISSVASQALPKRSIYPFMPQLTSGFNRQYIHWLVTQISEGYSINKNPNVNPQIRNFSKHNVYLEG